MPIVPPMTPPKKPESELAKRLRELLERKASLPKEEEREEKLLIPTNPNAPLPQQEESQLVERNEISEEECDKRVMEDPNAWVGAHLPGPDGTGNSILPRQ